MKYIELCAGIGGFRQGLERVGDFDCVGYAEIDKYASKLYKEYYKDDRNFGDVTKIAPEELPNFDMLVGGFPCQAFSMAGKRKGFEDTRGTIFFEFARIIKEKKPKICLFENVRGLLNHEKGKTYETILNTLDELGYDAEWKIFNTKNYGLPQNRERVYIVANLRERCATKVLFKREEHIKNCELHKEQVYTNTILATQANNGQGSYIIESKPTQQESKSNINIIGHIPSLHQRGNIYGDNGIIGALCATDYKTPKLILTGLIDNKNSSSNRIYDINGIARTLKATCGDKTGLYSLGDGKIRKLTPRECFRLQGFPDEMVDLGYEIGISDTQLYRMAGNAVSVPVVEHIVKIIKNEYFKEKKDL